MEEVTIRPYAPPDRPALERMLTALQEDMHAIDSFGFHRLYPEFGQRYTDMTLEKVAEREGRIFFALLGGEPVGCVVGTVKEHTERELLDMRPLRSGFVDELYVDPQTRSRGVGALLMREIEAYFRERGCEVVELGVLGDNVRGRVFYAREGYRVCDLTVVKRL